MSTTTRRLTSRVTSVLLGVFAPVFIAASADAQVTGGMKIAKFSLTSAEVPANGMMTLRQVFNGFGCTGENVSPSLTWSSAPAGTKSFAITVYDPDAPTGSGWWHWMLYDIPPTVTSLAAGAGAPGKAPLPSGAKLGMTDFGVKGWGGPCPPQGDKAHRYVFTVFALKTATLDVPASATSALVGYNLNGNALAKASFTALFGR
jgi:Raf kinase inhibitor-like YbhB/YbcL family protein